LRLGKLGLFFTLKAVQAWVVMHNFHSGSAYNDELLSTHVKNLCNNDFKRGFLKNAV
jgi:hypothetical protein